MDPSFSGIIMKYQPRNYKVPIFHKNSSKTRIRFENGKIQKKSTFYSNFQVLSFDNQKFIRICFQNKNWHSCIKKFPTLHFRLSEPQFLDGLFGQCISESSAISPLAIGQPLNELQRDVLRAELVRLADNGMDWPDATAQCVLAYFKLSVAYSLNYDPNFCNVRNPATVWALVQVGKRLLISFYRKTDYR